MAYCFFYFMDVTGYHMEGCQMFLFQEESGAGANFQYLSERFFNLPKRKIAVINLAKEVP